MTFLCMYIYIYIYTYYDIYIYIYICILNQIAMTLFSLLRSFPAFPTTSWSSKASAKGLKPEEPQPMAWGRGALEIHG